MLGEAIESGIETTTFGMFRPEIVDPFREQQNRMETTIGNVAGSIAGMIAPYGMTSKAVSSAFKAFGWSSRIYNTMGKIGALAGAETAMKLPAFANTLAESVSTMALYESANEFVRQMKTENPDLVQVAHKAMAGGITGMFLNTASAVTNARNPIVQGLAFATSMAIPEAINDASFGEDVFSKEYLETKVPQTLMQGFILGVINSRGWKERRDMINEATVNNVFNFQNLFIDEGGKYKTTKDIIEKYARIRYDSLPNEMKDVVKKIDNTLMFGEGTKIDAYRKRFFSIANDLGIKDKEAVLAIGDKQTTRAELMQKVTGKTSSADFTENDYRSFLTELKTYVNDSKPPDIKSAGFIEKLFSPSDRIAEVKGFSDMVSGFEQTSIAKRLMDDEKSMLIKASNSWRQMWNDEFRKVTGNKNSKDAARELSYIIENKPTSLKSLTPRMTKIINDYKKLTDIYFWRQNEALKAIGKTPIGTDEATGREIYIGKQDFYMRHSIDTAQLKVLGRKSDIPRPESLYITPEGRLRELGTQSTEMARTKNNLPYIQDPFTSLINMANYDLKTIYLREPLQILASQMRVLAETEGVNKLALKDMTSIVNHTILNRPTDADQRINDTMIKLLENNKIGQALDMQMAKWGKDIGKNPLATFTSMLNNSYYLATLGFRPKTVIRNATQIFIPMAYVQGKSVAKAMLYKDPKEFRDILDKSLVYRSVLSSGGEMVQTGEGASGVVGQMAFHSFSKGSIANMKYAMKMGYYEALDRITKNTKGWADEAGIALRRKNPKAISGNESRLITEYSEWLGSNTQYDYSALGMPAIFNSYVGKAAFALTSFPMNYFYKTVRSIAQVSFKGTFDLPSFKNVPAVGTMRTAAFKHFAGMALVAGAMAELGYDFSSVAPVSYNRDTGLETGIFEFRPSPAMTTLLSAKDYIFSDSPYLKAIALKNLKTGLLPIPGALAYKDIKKAIEDESKMNFLFYKTKEKKKKNISRAFGI